MQSNEMEPFFPLSEQFTTQEEPTYCALGTLTMCMNALGVDPQRRWRDATGPGWRWWADEMFAPASSCLPSLESVRRDGVSLRGFTQIASASGAAVKQHQPRPAGRGTEESFRASLAAAAASGPSSCHPASSLACLSSSSPLSPPPPLQSPKESSRSRSPSTSARAPLSPGSARAACVSRSASCAAAATARSTARSGAPYRACARRSAARPVGGEMV